MNLSARHIYLRPIKKDDALSIHLYAGEQETTKYMLWGPNSYEETLKYVEISLAAHNAVPKKVYRYAIILKHSDDLIGTIDLTIKSELIGEIGYILNKSYWGKGYVSEAAKIMINFAFNTLNLTKVIATCDKHNIASYRVMEKVGMRQVASFTKYNPKHQCDLEGLLYELDRP